MQAASTPAQGEKACAEILASAFQRYDIESHMDVWDNGRANCVAHVKGQGRRPGLLFVCHLDVVDPGDQPWRYPPFSGLERNGMVYGRGTTDMKGGIAACVSAICQTVAQGIPLQGDMVFAATAGEETDSCGIHHLMADSSWLPALAGIIIPEPTDFSIVTAHQGLLWLEIMTKGKTAHGSTPHLGINAIHAMTSVLHAIQGIELPSVTHARLGTCSMSVNTIHGGKALNVVPDQCTLGIDIRTLPGQDQTVILQKFQDALDALKDKDRDLRADISILRCEGALETNDQCAFVRNICHAVNIPQTQALGFTTDGPCLACLGLPIVIFGPGKGSVCHQSDECIALADVQRGVDYFKQIILSLLT